MKLKLPTSRSPPNGPKLAGARVMPHGAARGIVRGGGVAKDRLQHVVPFGSKIATAPVPGVACLSVASGRRIGYSHIPVAEGLHVERDEFACWIAPGVANAPLFTLVKEPLKTSMRPPACWRRTIGSRRLIASPV